MPVRPLLALLLACLPAGALAASVEESEVAARLAQDAGEFMDRLYGPGRAKVLVSVEGESAQIVTETELVTPILKPEVQTEDLPGYSKAPESPPVDYFQKDKETAQRRKSFEIKKIRVAAVLDDTLSEEQVNVVRRVLPELLRMESERGDDLSILRAPLLPAWKRAWMSPEGMRTGTMFAATALFVFSICLIGGVTLVRSLRAFAGELFVKSRSGPDLPKPALTSDGEGFPELEAGGVPMLGGPGARSEVPLLGMRFDFITDKEPNDVALFLAKEPPEDLALFFAYLADQNADAASRIFSKLPQALQTQTSQALVKLDMADPERLALLENRLKTSVEFGVRGPDRLGSILSRLSSDEREGLLDQIDPRSLEDVEKSLFPFEGIAEFKSEELRRLIVTVPFETWGAALRGLSTDVINRVLNELPAGTRNLVRDAASRPQPKDTVMAARSKILSQVYALADKGQIVISRQGAETELL